MAIYNTAGERVRVIYDGICSAPCAGGLTWDGTNTIGQPSASGVYLVVLGGKKVRATRKFAIVR